MQICKLIPRSGVVEVSRRNFNRVKFGTHTLGEVLRNEHFTNDPLDRAESVDGPVPMHEIKLVVRQ